MLSLKSHPDNILVAEIRHGKKKKTTPLYWHPVIKPELRNTIENLDYFFKDQNFTDRFELTHEQALNIQDHMTRDEICTELQAKHFQCKRFIQNSLNQEFDISDQPDMKLEVHFPKGSDTYAWCEWISGGTGSGKSFYLQKKLLTMLDGPKADRRKVIYFSPEWNLDTTIAPLKADKYKEWVTGIDCSDDSIEQSQFNTPEEFFKNEIQTRAKYASRGTILCADDPLDFAEGLQEPMRRLITTLQRVGRHSGVSVIFILHRLRHGIWSQQAQSSCRYLTCFPRSNKNKIRDYLNKEIGLTLPESRRAISDFAQHARALTIRLHTPQCLISEKMVRLI